MIILDKNNILVLDQIAEELPIRFYTNQLPKNVQYPFLLVHTENYTVLYNTHFKHAIIDIYVHRFRKIGDYPLEVLFQYYRLVEKLSDRFKERITFVFPDLPFDPKYFHGVQYPENIKKTYTYHLMFVKLADKLYFKNGTKCMLVIQHRQNITDVERSCFIVQDMLTFFKRDPVHAIGVGSLCVNRSPRQIAHYINTVGKFFRNITIHGFGVRLDTIKFLSNDVAKRYSYDSTGWTRPVNSEVLKILNISKRRSAYSQTERLIYFLVYLKRLCELCKRHDLADEIEKIIETKILKQK